MTSPQFGLVIVGDEILSGKRQDKHMAKVIELLTARGLALSWARTWATTGRASPRAAPRVCQRRHRLQLRRHRRHARRPHPPVRRRGAGPPAGAAPRGEGPDPAAHAGRGTRAGAALRARPTRQPAPPEHGRVPAGRRADRQPVQQDPGLLGRRRALRARLPGDGAPDDRKPARRPLRRAARRQVQTERRWWSTARWKRR
jgi:hypothetical protein